MSRSVVTLALLAFAACAGPSTTPTTSDNTSPWDNSDDLRASGKSDDGPADMSQPVPVNHPHDMSSPVSTGGSAPAGQLGCHGYGLCYGACNVSALDQNQFNQCTASCDSRAVATAVQAMNGAFSCGLSACVAAQRCASTNDTSDNCITCAYDAVSAVFGLACDSDPICNTSSCSAALSACATSMP